MAAGIAAQNQLYDSVSDLMMRIGKEEKALRQAANSQAKEAKALRRKLYADELAQIETLFIRCFIVCRRAVEGASPYDGSGTDPRARLWAGRRPLRGCSILRSFAARSHDSAYPRLYYYPIERFEIFRPDLHHPALQPLRIHKVFPAVCALSGTNLSRNLSKPSYWIIVLSPFTCPPPTKHGLLNPAPCSRS